MLSDKMSLGTQIVDPRKLEAAIPGASNGTTVAENIAAIAKVYPSFPRSAITATRSTDTMEILLQGGKGFAIVGNYHDLPSHFQRWDPAFAATNPAGHATYIQIDGPAGSREWSLRDGKFVWWMDPLATPGYPGEWMELAIMFGFLNGSTNAYGGEGSAVSTGGGPSQPVPDVSVSFNLIAGPSGVAVVVQDGTAVMALSDGKLHAVPKGTSYGVAHPMSLSQPIPGGSPTADRRTSWLVQTPWGAAALLISNALFKADNPTDCTAAIAADRAKAHIVWS